MRLFVSYRRSDSDYIAGRIREHLIQHFGTANVFMDVDDIPLGADFRTALQDAVSRCNAVLVIIGPTWLNAVHENGTRRLDHETDFVRIEIETALSREIPVVPVLVGRARVPSSSDLPTSIQSLAFRQGMTVRPDPDFKHDLSVLIKALGAWSTASAPPRPEAPPPRHPPESTPAPPTASAPPRPEGRKPEANDLFIYVADGIVLGKATLSEIQRKAMSGDGVSKSLVPDRSQFGYTRAEFLNGVLIKYKLLNTHFFPSWKEKKFEDMQMADMSRYLQELGYSVEPTGPHPMREWYAFWDKDHAAWVHGKKKLPDGRRVTVKVLFYAKGAQAVAQTNCILSIEVAIL